MEVAIAATGDSRRPEWSGHAVFNRSSGRNGRLSTCRSPRCRHIDRARAQAEYRLETTSAWLSAYAHKLRTHICSCCLFLLFELLHGACACRLAAFLNSKGKRGARLLHARTLAPASALGKRPAAPSRSWPPWEQHL